MSDAVFNRYDIRGTYPGEIDEAVAERLGMAAGRYAEEHGRGTVVVGRDSRESSYAIHSPFMAGARAAGANVVDVGVGTTDRTALAAQHYGGIGAMLTASHHAWERTGVKFLYERGHGFGNDDLDRIRELYRREPADDGEGSLLRVQHEWDEQYIETLADWCRGHDHGIDGTVLLDAAGGAERTAAAVFTELGADVVEHDWEERPVPEPTPDSRAAVRERLERGTADVAAGFDPDADRVYVVHPDLGWIGGDHLFYLLGRILRPERVIASVDTSPLIEQLDAAITYTRVGDVFVSAAGVDQDADLLGEPNGHYAVTDCCWYNSGILAGAILAAHHDDLPALLAPVQDYRTERFVEQYADAAARDNAMQQVKKRVAKQYAVLDRVDGVKFAADGLTALVRPSGTSPKLRLVVHGEGDIGEAAASLRDSVFQDG